MKRIFSVRNFCLLSFALWKKEKQRAASRQDLLMKINFLKNFPSTKAILSTIPVLGIFP